VSRVYGWQCVIPFNNSFVCVCCYADYYPRETLPTLSYFPHHHYNLDRVEAQPLVKCFVGTNAKKPSRFNMVDAVDQGDMTKWADATLRTFRGQIWAEDKMDEDKAVGSTPRGRASAKRLSKAVSVQQTERKCQVLKSRYMDMDGIPPCNLHTLGLGTAPYIKKVLKKMFIGPTKSTLEEIEVILARISSRPSTAGVTSFPEGFSSWPRMGGQQNFDLIAWLAIAMALSEKMDAYRDLRQMVGEMAYLHIQCCRRIYHESQLGANLDELRLYAQEVADKPPEQRWGGPLWKNKMWVGGVEGNVEWGECPPGDADNAVEIDEMLVESDGEEDAAESDDEESDGEDSDNAAESDDEEGDGEDNAAESDDEEGDADSESDEKDSTNFGGSDLPVEELLERTGSDEDASMEGHCCEEGVRRGKQLTDVAKKALGLLSDQLRVVRWDMSKKAKPGEIMHVIRRHIPLHGAWVYTGQGARFEGEHKMYNKFLRCVNWKTKHKSVQMRVMEVQVANVVLEEYDYWLDRTATKIPGQLEVEEKIARGGGSVEIQVEGGEMGMVLSGAVLKCAVSMAELKNKRVPLSLTGVGKKVMEEGTIRKLPDALSGWLVTYLLSYKDEVPIHWVKTFDSIRNLPKGPERTRRENVYVKHLSDLLLLKDSGVNVQMYGNLKLVNVSRYRRQADDEHPFACMPTRDEDGTFVQVEEASNKSYASIQVHPGDSVRTQEDAAEMVQVRLGDASEDNAESEPEDAAHEGAEDDEDEREGASAATVTVQPTVIPNLKKRKTTREAERLQLEAAIAIGQTVTWDEVRAGKLAGGCFVNPLKGRTRQRHVPVISQPEPENAVGHGAAASGLHAPAESVSGESDSSRRDNTEFLGGEDDLLYVEYGMVQALVVFDVLPSAGDDLKWLHGLQLAACQFWDELDGKNGSRKPPAYACPHVKYMEQQPFANFVPMKHIVDRAIFIEDSRWVEASPKGRKRAFLASALMR
jgi:hypothetical protein